MKPRIIFFDIDGTLVPLKEGTAPERWKLCKNCGRTAQALHCHQAVPP